jgi:hypothetical protein
MIHPEDLGPYQDKPSDPMIYLKDLCSYQGVLSNPIVHLDDLGIIWIYLVLSWSARRTQRT